MTARHAPDRASSGMGRRPDGGAAAEVEDGTMRNLADWLERHLSMLEWETVHMANSLNEYMQAKGRLEAAGIRTRTTRQRGMGLQRDRMPIVASETYEIRVQRDKADRARNLIAGGGRRLQF